MYLKAIILEDDVKEKSECYMTYYFFDDEIY
jgi:hypothetical protein